MSNADRARAALAADGVAVGAAGTGRRPAAPLRDKVAATRAALPVRKDGKCHALCIADRLNLEKMVTALSPDISSTIAAAVQDAPEEDLSEFADSLEVGLGRSRALTLTVEGGGEESSSFCCWPFAFRSSSAAASVPDVQEGLPPGLAGAELAELFGSGENCVLRIRLPRNIDLFVFRFGAVVFWTSEHHAGETMKEVSHCLKKHFSFHVLPAHEVDEDSMEFVIPRQDEEEDFVQPDGSDPAAVGAASIRQDQIILRTTNPYEKLAHSYALAQSVRLGVFELIVDRSIEKTRSIPETMANHGEVVLDERELSKQIGGLMMLRCDVNLHTDILDTPDLFWDEDDFEPHYLACRGYFDIDKRVDILNQRLGVLKDLYDLLQNTLNVKHGNKLEWIIIILILVEVVLELLELVHDAWSG